MNNASHGIMWEIVEEGAMGSVLQKLWEPRWERVNFFLAPRGRISVAMVGRVPQEGHDLTSASL